MANLFPDHADLYHTGIVVHDLEQAKAELSEQLSSLDIPEETYDLVVDTCLKGVGNTIQATAPAMIEAGRGGSYGPVPVVSPREISNAVLFLASDEARYITGVALPVDAGNANKP